MIRIAGKDIQLIAEVKVRSPFGFVSDKSWDELFQLADSVGDIISIHTDPRWGGSFELIKKAKSLSKKPILAKGIHETDDLLQKAFNSGADYALVVGRIPELPPDFLNKCLIEPDSLKDLESIPADMKAVWNSRDLKTGGFKKETFEEARNLFTGWLCQASNIKSVTDIHPRADAALVGEHLEELVLSLK